MPSGGCSLSARRAACRTRRAAPSAAPEKRSAGGRERRCRAVVDLAITRKLRRRRSVPRSAVPPRLGNALPAWKFGLSPDRSGLGIAWLTGQGGVVVSRAVPGGYGIRRGGKACVRLRGFGTRAALTAVHRAVRRCSHAGTRASSGPCDCAITTSALSISRGL